ncbi:hypothetical protein RRG08_033391 [Elysia crispata]|uniref:Uncharacterized protein n=1 Tax=Elysia crispata TaxID=231223 RepID=A0AAE0YZ32_9GAST|nr:hypothetical protein RRG08_033391 [Elysia crispata]
MHRSQDLGIEKRKEKNSFLLENRPGSRSLLQFCNKIAPIPWSEASVRTMNGAFISGVIKTGSEAKMGDTVLKAY